MFDYLLDCKFSVWKLTDLKCNLQYSKYLSSYFKSWCWIYMLTNLATVYEIFHILQHHSWVDLIITGLGHLITLVMEFSLGKNYRCWISPKTFYACLPSTLYYLHHCCTLKFKTISSRVKKFIYITYLV